MTKFAACLPALAFLSALGMAVTAFAARPAQPVMRHHVLPMETAGFYAVFLPEDFDPVSGRKYALCVILHGSGSTEVSHGRSISGTLGLGGIIYIAPRAPHPHIEAIQEYKGAGWTARPNFPPEWGGFGDSTFPKAEIEAVDPPRQYADWIARCIRDARRRYPIRDDKAVIVGHSQGADFAHETALRHPGLVKAYAAYAGDYEGTLEDDSAAAVLKRAGIRPLVSHCDGDSIVKAEYGRKLAAYLRKHGVPHDTAFFPGGSHWVASRPGNAIRAFVSRQVFGREPPPRKGRVKITGVLGGTQADSAGLAPGDVIRTYDGRPVRNEDEYREAMEAAKTKAGTGATVKVGLIQGGKAKERAFRPGPLGIHIVDD